MKTRVVALLLAMAALPAFAHVTLAVDKAPAGSYFKAVLQVPHGCKGAATTGITVLLPEGVQKPRPQPKTGWTLDFKKEKLAQAYDFYGEKVTEDVRQISWTKGNLPDDQFDEFGISLKLPEAAGRVLLFKVIQYCGDQKTEWTIDPATLPAGHAHHSTPAATLTLLPANPAHTH